jgi:hypothetical protein
MESWYAYMLKLQEMYEQNPGGKVTLLRRDVGEITGSLSEVEEFGCQISDDSVPEASKYTFVAYADIRSIVTDEWDASKM